MTRKAHPVGTPFFIFAENEANKSTIAGLGRVSKLHGDGSQFAATIAPVGFPPTIEVVPNIRRDVCFFIDDLDAEELDQLWTAFCRHFPSEAAAICMQPRPGGVGSFVGGNFTTTVTPGQVVHTMAHPNLYQSTTNAGHLVNNQFLTNASLTYNPMLVVDPNTGKTFVKKTNGNTV